MKIAYLAGVSFRRDLELFIWQPRGVLDEPHVEKIIAILEGVEDEANHPFDRYTDLSKLDQVDVSFDYVFQISLHRRAVYGNRSPIKSVFYVEDRATAQVALTHAVVTAESPLQVKVCLQKSAAAQWLGVSVGDLEPDR
ncbi:MAG TPA: hypothetical protein VGM62_08150 [Chthoniobacterales bacterium]